MALPGQIFDECRTRTPLATVSAGVCGGRGSGNNGRTASFHGEKSPSFMVYDDGFTTVGWAHLGRDHFVMHARGCRSWDDRRHNWSAKPVGGSPNTRRGPLNPKPAAGYSSVCWSWWSHLPNAPCNARGPCGARLLLAAACQRRPAPIPPRMGGRTRSATADLFDQGVDSAQLTDSGTTFAPMSKLRTSNVLPAGDVSDPGRQVLIISLVVASGRRQPKYVNGRRRRCYQTPQSLRLNGSGRRAETGALIVLKGTMHVSPPLRPGFTACLAPWERRGAFFLGGGDDERKLEELWRVSRARLCFDGDSERIRAA